MWRFVLLVALLASVAKLAPNASAQTGGGRVSVGSGTAVVGQAAYVNVLAHDVPAPGTGAYVVFIQFDPEVVHMRNCAVDHHSTCETPDDRTIRITGVSTESFSGNWVVAGITLLCAGAGVSSLSVIIHQWGSSIPETMTPPPGIENGTLTCFAATADTPATTGPSATATPASAALPSTGSGGGSTPSVAWLPIVLLASAGAVVLGATYRRLRS
jgi:hypothetical protein